MRSIVSSTVLALALVTSAATGCVMDPSAEAEESVDEGELGGPSMVAATPGTLDFGPVAIGSKKTLAVKLTNTGATAINCNGIYPNHPGLTVSTSWISKLEPGASLTMYVTLAPSKPEAVSSSVALYDGKTQWFTVPVAGKAY